jgi:adenine-specific DNA-methyltransferase
LSKISEGIEILRSLGLPKAQQNERSALTLLSLLDLRQNDSWSNAKQRLIRIHDILEFIKSVYAKTYAENTRETIRRQTLHQFVQAGIADINPDNKSRPTNSPATVYSITGEALDVVKAFGTGEWKIRLEQFTKEKGKLVDKYEKRREEKRISVTLPEGASLTLSPGNHNELQAEIIEVLQPRFFPHSKLIYLGDTARKLLFVEEEELQRLNIPITEHDKLPDVVLHDESKSILFLIEAVTSHGPITPKRQVELEEILIDCKARRIYVSVFPNFHVLKKHLDNIAWETEIWLADRPDHMIHFNGPKFLDIS